MLCVAALSSYFLQQNLHYCSDFDIVRPLFWPEIMRYSQTSRLEYIKRAYINALRRDLNLSIFSSETYTIAQISTSSDLLSDLK